MELRLTEQEALALYRIILRWDELGSLTTEDDEERQHDCKNAVNA